MEGVQIAALGVMAAFYLAYFSKMLLQRRKGLQTDQIGKGNKPKTLLMIEILMKIATFAVVPVEIASIVWETHLWNLALCRTGTAVAAVGVAVFMIAMWTMRDNWRAGIPEKDKTELVTAGIYRFSRNPAFLGFDLMYIGLLLAFFNWVHLAFALFAVVMLHLQILQEERFLAAAFGEAYRSYQKRVGRYFIL